MKNYESTNKKVKFFKGKSYFNIPNIKEKNKKKKKFQQFQIYI